MKQWYAKLKEDIPWIGDFLCLLGALLGIGIIVICTDNWTFEPLLTIVLSTLMSVIFAIFAYKDMAEWIKERRRDLRLREIPSTVSAAVLKERLEQMAHVLANTECRIDIGEKGALWADNVVFHANILKQRWCAAVSLPHGGILMPSQKKRIAAQSEVKIPAKLLNDSLTSCIICHNQGTLSVYPGDCAPLLKSELMPGLLSEEDADFQKWLKEYLALHTEED